jgi:hypothetical protein
MLRVYINLQRPPRKGRDRHYFFLAGLTVFSSKDAAEVNLNILSIRCVMPDNDWCRGIGVGVSFGGVGR